MSASAPKCTYLVAYDGQGPVPPRPCARDATGGAPYCGVHAKVATRWEKVEVRPGGFCVGCAQPATSYVMDGVTVALCGRHARSLARAIREGR